MDWQAKWIKPARDLGDVVPLFTRRFDAAKEVTAAALRITALGVYEASLNGKRVGRFVLAPGFTAYEHRLQVQTYDVTAMLQETNELCVLVGKGWHRSPLMSWQSCPRQQELMAAPAGLTAELTIRFADGTQETLVTDESWQVSESAVRFSEIYDGEVYDATFTPHAVSPAACFDGPTQALIPQQGEEVTEHERIAPARIFTTPRGERLIDFGQEVTGFLEVHVTAQAGESVEVAFAEVLDKDGNFYNGNYRGIKAQYRYTCRDGAQSYKTKLTFYGFRYAKLVAFPGGIQNAAPENFTAIAVHSQLRQTGRLSCSDPLLDRLFSNILWGQKGNFLDVPTDCPQRNERLGWTGDAQVFCRTACLNYDAEKFFTKWLADLAANQHPSGGVGHVIPDVLSHDENHKSSAAWGDAATVCPWEVYMAYGNPAILEAQYESMCRWVGYITNTTTTPYLWTGGKHFGDWLGLDAPSGSYKGSSREDLIATAFYAYSTSLVIKAGRVLRRDVSGYEQLYDHIAAAFRKAFPTYETQTECVLAAHFGLAEDPAAAAAQLVRLIKASGGGLQTGFVGTPYLLHTLSEFGYTDLAYSLLLRKDYPSWLYAIGKGATTVWEHWDGIMENGDFWSADMNSFNHYAYGAVADWVYGVAAGITPAEDAPGYAKVCIAPHPDARLDWLSASVDTRRGLVSSKWSKQEGFWRYEIVTPVEAQVTIAGKTETVAPGSYLFFSPIGG